MLCKFKRAYQISDDESAPPPVPSCLLHTLVSNFEMNITFTYKPCGLPETSVVLNNSELTVCAEYVNIPPYETNKWDIFVGDEC